MTHTNNLISWQQLENYLSFYYKNEIKLKSWTRIGSGWTATGYKVEFEKDGLLYKVVMRSLDSVNYSHDYLSDRAAYFLMQDHTSKLLPNHVESLGVIGVKGEIGYDVVKVDDIKEYYQITEWAEGYEYTEDLERMFNNNRVESDDLFKIKRLSDYLAQIHSIKYSGGLETALSLYKRHTRDYVGSQFLLDVLDTYPEKYFIGKKEMYKFVIDIFKSREKLKNNFNRLSKIHGDFHPGNIRFNKNDLIVLDASKHIWGEPADDVAALTINYIWYAIRQTGKFTGIFNKLFKVFCNNYLERSNDSGIIKNIPLFLCLRSIVLNHPLYFNVDDDIRIKFHRYCYDLLKKGSLEF